MKRKKSKKVYLQKIELQNEREMTDVDYFYEERDNLNKTREESLSLIENRTFEIASGGLVFSLTILSYLSSVGKLIENWSWVTIVIWSLFTFVIILHYISQFISRRNAEKLMDSVDEKIRSGQSYDDRAINAEHRRQERLLRIFNLVTSVITIVGVILLLVFTFICIRNS